ncbi:polysaccharide export protein EpsE [Sphaerotilaceae bacterium SBD11-9]
MRKFFHGFLLMLVLCSTGRAQTAAEYLLGPGDVIRINVYQNPDLTLETRLTEQGQITFPLIGNVSLGGTTLSGAQDRIAKLLRDGGFVLKPQVSVQIVQVRSSQISILGQVGRPGRYPIETANSKVSEMIASAGGVLPGGGDVVTLSGTRNGKPVKYDIDLPAIMQAGRADLDVVVANGDIIYVDRAAVVYLYGEVQRPGAIRLERGMTLMQALAQAGGLTQRGTERGMRVHRRDANGNLNVLQLKLSDPIEREDVIYVRESVF